jgi:tricorn protease
MAGNDVGYIRFPTIYGDRVVFTAEDDLWAVDAGGGIARRLSAGLGAFARPRFSPSGEQLVFVGREAGDADLYSMPAGGGPLTRLTFTGEVVALAGFMPDGEAVAAITAKTPFPHTPDLYRVPLSGGPAIRLAWGPATAIAYGPEGGVVLGRKTQDPATWKRYRGGTAGELWIDAQGTGDFRLYQVPGHGNLASPMWIQDRIYFLSDYEGIGNLYSMRPDGSDLTRHTDHQDYYARNATTDGHRVVYHAGGDLWIFDPRDGTSHQIPVALFSQRTQRERRYVEAALFLTDFDPHPDQTELVMATRGQAFGFRPFDGPVRALGPGSGVRQRLFRWLGHGDRLVGIDDARGAERLVMVDPESPGEPEVLYDGEMGQVLLVEAAPDGSRVAFSNRRGDLWLVDVATKVATRAEASRFGHVTGLAWSPDSQYLAYAMPLSPSKTAIRVWHAAVGEGHTVTEPLLHDEAPAWDPAGRFLYFLGSRFLNPVMDQVAFDLGFPRATRPCLVTLTASQRSPFLGPPPTAEDPGAEDGEDDGEPERLRIDFEGIADRVVPFPVPDGRYTNLSALASKVLWITWPVRGELASDPWGNPAPRVDGTLEVYDLALRERDTLMGGVTGFRLARDRRHLLVRSGHKLRWLKAGDKPDPKAGDEPGQKSGFIDLKRVPVLVDPPAEWAEMLRETWRAMRNRFWSEDMSGVDWDAMYERYARLLPRLATRGEFSDLIWEMQGELGTSHAYESGGDYRPAPPYQPGFLGADFSWDAEAGGWRVTHIVHGDPSSPGYDSPLRTPGANVLEGDVLTAIDGRPASAAASPEHLLMRRRNQEVELRFQRPGAAPRTVLVRTLASERLARYREWVELNRAWVHGESRGRVGYLHVPDMMAWGFAEFYRLYGTEVLHDALLVDVRFNRGGYINMAPLLLEKLGRQIIAYMHPRWREPWTFPEGAPHGPVVAIANDWTASTGDLFSHSFKLLGLGPLVGRRTWGGVIGIMGGVTLVDGSVVTQPEFASWFGDVGWGVENYGTDPTIPVDMRPQDYAAGRDPQLERALAEALLLLEQAPPASPPVAPRPSKVAPPLPPRRPS